MDSSNSPGLTGPDTSTARRDSLSVETLEPYVPGPGLKWSTTSVLPSSTETLRDYLVYPGNQTKKNNSQEERVTEKKYFDHREKLSWQSCRLWTRYEFIQAPASIQRKNYMITAEGEKPITEYCYCDILEELLDQMGDNITVQRNKEERRIDVIVESKEQVEKLKNVALSCCNINIVENVSKHETRGIIKTHVFEKCPEEKIKNTLNRLNKGENWQIKNVYKIKKKVNGVLQPTVAISLTFDTPDLPGKIYIQPGFKTPVTLSIPLPRRCFKCQQFGHRSGPRCRAPVPVCAKCAGEAHPEGEFCSNQPKCVNCDGNHPSYYNQCPRYKYEKKLLEVKTIEKLTFREAKEVMKNYTLQNGVSYASLLKKSPPFIRSEITQQTPGPSNIQIPYIRDQNYNMQPTPAVTQVIPYDASVISEVILSVNSDAGKKHTKLIDQPSTDSTIVWNTVKENKGKRCRSSSKNSLNSPTEKGKRSKGAGETCSNTENELMECTTELADVINDLRPKGSSASNTEKSAVMYSSKIAEDIQKPKTSEPPDGVQVAGYSGFKAQTHSTDLRSILLREGKRSPSRHRDRKTKDKEKQRKHEHSPRKRNKTPQHNREPSRRSASSSKR